MTNQTFPASMIISAILLLLIACSVNSAQLQAAVETGYQNPEDQVTKLQHMFLTPSLPSNRSLEKNQADYYEIFIVPRDSKLTILKENPVGQVELFISSDPTNKYPSEKEHNYTTKTTNRNWIQFDKKDLIKACKPQSDTLCVLYVAVIPQGTAVSYSISLKKNLSKNSRFFPLKHLEDGKKLHLTLSDADKLQPQIFYFYTLPSEASFVRVVAYSKEIIMYAQALDIETDILSLLDVNMPTNSSYDFVSEGTSERFKQNLAILSVPTGDPALVVVSLYFEETYAIFGDSYSIRRDSQIMPIFLGRQYKGTLEKDKYKYFALRVEDSGCNLIVSANSHDSQELSIVAASPRQGVLPTIENSSFKTRKLYGSKFLEANLCRDLECHSWQDIYGTWIIGLYGQNSSEFTLFTTCAGQQIHKSSFDKTEQASLKSSVFGSLPLYSLYEPRTTNPISVKTDRFSPVSYYIRQVSKDEDFIFNLPNKTNYDWSNFHEIKREACDNCAYLITIENYLNPESNLNDFEMTISEPKTQIIYTEKGNPVIGSLSSSSSHIICFEYNTAEDIYLSITSEAEKLELYISNNSDVSTDNYLWKTEIACGNQTQLLKVPTFSDTKDSKYQEYEESYYRASYYAQIRNPTLQKVNYTIVSFKPIEQSKQDDKSFSLIPQGSQAIVFYASEEENKFIEVSVDVEGCDKLPQKTNSLEMKAYYWPDDILGFAARSVPISTMNIITEKIGAKGKIYKMVSKKGKFVFVLTQNYHEKFYLTTKITNPTDRILAIKHNFNGKVALTPGEIQTYQTVLPGPGVWYLHGYSCKEARSYLTIQDGLGTEGANISKTESGQQFFYKAAVLEGNTTKLIKLVSDPEVAWAHSRELATHVHYTNFSNGFVLKSSFLKGANLYNYNGHSTGITIKAKDSNAIFVEISPLKIYEFDPLQDTVFHEIIACPSRGMNLRNLCGTDFNCVIEKTEEYKIQEQNQTQITIRVRQIGRHNVVVLAHIKSQGQEVNTILVGEREAEIWRDDNLDNSLQPVPQEEIKQDLEVILVEESSEKQWNELEIENEAKKVEEVII